MDFETIRRVTADLTDHQIEEWHKMAFIVAEEKGYCYAYCDYFCRRAIAALAREGWQPITTAPAQAAEGEATELADWLDNHAQHLERMEEVGAMPKSELTPRIARAAELLRQQVSEYVPADEQIRHALTHGFMFTLPSSTEWNAEQLSQLLRVLASILDSLGIPAWPGSVIRAAEMLSAQVHTPAPAAEGEAEAIAIKLQQLAPQNPLGIADPTITRAAELLRQQGLLPRQPPPFSERPWERPGWCDEQGRCWMGDPGGDDVSSSWRLAKFNNPQAADLWQLSGFSWSLPHWAIPSIPTINPTQEEA